MLFEYWGGKIPVDPFMVADALEMHVAQKRLDPDVSGILQLSTDGRPLIHLNSSDGRRRRRFTCAHEIGHYFKRDGKDGHAEHIFYRDETTSKGTDVDERYANAFAAELLMPRHVVEQRVAMGEGEAEMADYFEVSEAAMVNRLKSLGLYPLF